MSRILQLRKLMATEPNPDIKAGYKREIAALTDTSRSAMKKRGTRITQTMKKSELPWVNLDDDHPVVMGDDGTWKYVAAADEGDTPYFVGFDDHTTGGVIVYAGDEEHAEEIAAEAILAANPNYFQDENSFMEENGVDPNTVDWDTTSSDEIVGQHGGSMIYINGAGYVSTTGSPTIRRLKRPTPPKSAVDALAKVKAAATEFSTKYADQLKGNIVGTSYLSRDLRYFLLAQGKDERDELIDSLEKSIAFEQKFQGDPEEAAPSDFLPDAQALLSALKAFRFPSEGATKAARPAMKKRGTAVRKAGGPVKYSDLSPKAKDRARTDVRTSDSDYIDADQITEDLKDYIKENHPWYEDVKVYWSVGYVQGDYANLDSGYLDVDAFAQAKGITPVEPEYADDAAYSTRIKIEDGKLDTDYQGEFSDEFWEAAKDDLSDLNTYGGRALYRVAREDMDGFNEDEYLDDFIEGNDHIYQFNADGSRYEYEGMSDEDGDDDEDYEASAKPKMRKRAYPGKVGDFIAVTAVPEEAQFVSNSQDVAALKESLGPEAQEYDSFFAVVGDGDYDAVWGMYGIVPYDNKQVARVA